MFKQLVLIIALVISATSFSRTIVVNPKRTIKIYGAIGKNAIQKAQILEKLSMTSNEPIYLIINSPGGSVTPGMQFLNAMRVAKYRGSKLICAVPMLATSMAFHYLAECDQRYAFSYSLLLWHPMKISGSFISLSADEMEYLIKVMRSWELPLNNRLMSVLDVTKEEFYYHYGHETLFTATSLRQLSPHFITIIDNIMGVNGLFEVTE